MYYEAIYTPRSIKNLKPEAHKVIGKKIALLYSGSMLKGPHKGKPAYVPASNFAVIPVCDLQKLESISRNKWDEICREMEGY